MKRILTLLTAVSMAFATTACVGSPESTQTNNDQSKKEIKGEITVSCYESMMYKGFVEEAAKQFEKKYPGTKVKFQGFTAVPEMAAGGAVAATAAAAPVDVLGEKGATPKADYNNKVNTELMSGGGADIMATDVIPYYKYADSGMLEDLSKYMEKDPDFKKSDYRENILNASKYKGKQIVFPMDYDFSFFGYDTQFLDKEAQDTLNSKNTFTYNSLMKIGSKSFNENKNQKVKMFDLYGAKSLFNELFNTNYDKYIDIENKKANFKDGSFTAMLQSTMESANKGYLKEEIKVDPKKDDREAYSKMFLETKNFYNTNHYFDLFKFFVDIKLGKNMAIAGSQISKTSKIGGLVESDSGKKSLEILHGFVMNSNSKNKETAWEFIKFMASEEVQTSLNLYGMPVNNKAGERKAKEVISSMTGNPNMDTGSDSIKLTKEQATSYENYMKAINDLSGSLNNVMIKDSTIEQIVQSEVKYFYDGTKTAQEVADNLQNKVQLYLNE